MSILAGNSKLTMRMMSMTKKMSSVISSSSQPTASASASVINGLMSNISGVISNKLNFSELGTYGQNQPAATKNSNSTEIVMPYHPTPTRIFTLTLFPETLPTTDIAIENVDVYSRQQQLSLDVGETDNNNSSEEEMMSNLSIWLISTLKRRKKKMNKHKLRKRRKLLRLKSKK